MRANISELIELAEQGDPEAILSLEQSQAQRVYEERKSEVPKNWSIRQADLKRLGEGFLQNIFRGIHNIGLHDEIMNVQNPDEILAQFYATGVMKRRNAHLRGNAGNLEFYGLIKNMDQLAYKNQKFREMAKKCKKRFPSAPGDQMKRLEKLDESDRDAFVTAFLEPYVLSFAESQLEGEFLDPHTKTGYIRGIVCLISNDYSKTH